MMKNLRKFYKYNIKNREMFFIEPKMSLKSWYDRINKNRYRLSI